MMMLVFLDVFYYRNRYSEYNNIETKVDVIVVVVVVDDVWIEIESFGQSSLVGDKKNRTGIKPNVTVEY